MDWLSWTQGARWTTHYLLDHSICSARRCSGRLRSLRSAWRGSSRRGPPARLTTRSSIGFSALACPRAIYYNSFGRPEPVPVGFRGDVSISRQTMLLRGGATLMNSSRDSHGMPPPPARWTEAGVWGVIVRTEGWGWHTCVLCLRQRGRRFAAPSAAPGLI